MSVEPANDVLFGLAEQYHLAGDYRAGSVAAREAATLAQLSGDLAGQARALRSLAHQLLRLGEMEASVTACREAVIALTDIDDEAGVGHMLSTQAIPLNDLGMHDEALALLAASRDIAQRLGDRDLLYAVHNRIGVVHGSMGNRELSDEYFAHALTMAEVADVEDRFCLLNNIGDNAVHRVAQLRAAGDAEAAESTLRAALGHIGEALRLARASANPYRISISLDNLGMLVALDGDYDNALRILVEAETIAALNGYRPLESSVIQHQAHIRLKRGEHNGALEGLMKALERAVDAAEKPMVLEIHRELANAYEQVGDFAAALGHHRRFHTLEREIVNEVAVVRARLAAHGFELDNARLAAHDAGLEAELHRLRSAELEAANVIWQQQAFEDALTGLPNRRFLEMRLPELAAEGQLSVVVADVDFFKGVNDRFGHFIGDEVLQQIAALLRDNVRAGDLVARFGGEEFLIALPGLGIEDAGARCEILRAQVAAYPWEARQSGLAVTISMGVTILTAAGDLSTALTQADRLLYAAKRNGRNRVEAG